MPNSPTTSPEDRGLDSSRVTQCYNDWVKDHPGKSYADWVLIIHDQADRDSAAFWEKDLEDFRAKRRAEQQANLPKSPPES